MKKNALTILKNKEKTYNNDCIIIYNKNQLLYKENEYNMKLEINKDHLVLTKENNETKSVFIFNKKKSNIDYFLKNNNYSMSIPVKLKKMDIKDDYILINYLIEENEFNYEIFIKEDVC